MQLSWERVELTKRHPLTISRGTIAGATSVIVSVAAEGIVGRGEMAPSSVTGDTPESAVADLTRWQLRLETRHPLQRQVIESDIAASDVEHDSGSATRCALDVALHDWAGQRTGLALWKLWGLNLDCIAPTSLTVGLNPPDVVRQVTAEILSRTKARILKVKLGSPAGLDHDRDVFSAAVEAAAKFGPITWRVDVNGGWTVPSAQMMIPWLAERGVEMVEQPLAKGDEDALEAVHSFSTLPIFVDESISTARDIVLLADRVDGVNLKLMKTGGITEAVRLIHTARAHGLKVMIGCMGESSLSIAAGAHLAPLFDAIDLDSHLNLINDPFTGIELVNGRVLPGDGPGLGVNRRNQEPAP